MTQHPSVKLLAILHEQQCMALEELLSCFPELTWNQVFLLVDELSRQAVIGLRRRGFQYELRALTQSV